MTNSNDKLMDLLAQRASVGLSDDEERTLEHMLEAKGLLEDDDVELAVAAAWNAFALGSADEGAAPAPASLRAKLEADADAFFDNDRAAGNVTDFSAARVGREAEEKLVKAGTLARTGLIGWAVAATLLVAMFVTGGPERDVTIDLAEARAGLISASTSTMVLPWAPPQAAGYEQVTGDVVWNDARQEGYLRLAGMPVNDPAVSQFQLWIVDPDRDANPVDGGVFDIPAGVGEVIIPISAKLRVSDPEAFAITREKPGGVVVSAGPLLVVASG